MPVPTHGPDCQTVLYRTHCPDCTETVYFFACTCGSRVFFNLNRPPWNPHEDTCIPYLARYLLDVKGTSAAALWGLIEEHSRRYGVSLTPAITRGLGGVLGRRHRGVTVLDVQPDEVNALVLARVISVNRQVNFLKRFRLPASARGRTVIGRLADEAHVEIVLRTEPDELTGFADQYTAYLPLQNFDPELIRPGQPIHFDLVPYPIPGRDPLWLVEEFYTSESRPYDTPSRPTTRSS